MPPAVVLWGKAPCWGGRPLRREVPGGAGRCASRWSLRFCGRRKTLKIEKEAVRGKWQAEKTRKMKKEAVRFSENLLGTGVIMHQLFLISWENDASHPPILEPLKAFKQILFQKSKKYLRLLTASKWEKDGFIRRQI